MKAAIEAVKDLIEGGNGRAAYQTAVSFTRAPGTSRGRQVRRGALAEAGVVLDHEAELARFVDPPVAVAAEVEVLDFLIKTTAR